jgi:hypothetical protein
MTLIASASTLIVHFIWVGTDLKRRADTGQLSFTLRRAGYSGRTGASISVAA